MERTAKINQVKDIMGSNFIGPSELDAIAEKMGIISPYQFEPSLPAIPFETSFLRKNAKDFLLILGSPYTRTKESLTLEKMRSFFGIDPLIMEPCFYNQDWYIKEDFATKVTIEFKWYLLKTDVYEKSRGRQPGEFLSKTNRIINLPSAILCAYSFFAWYFHNRGEILWKHDYVWCKDKDFNGDQVYVGRYLDPAGLNKNGFSIHRHLNIRNNYGIISELFL